MSEKLPGLARRRPPQSKTRGGHEPKKKPVVVDLDLDRTGGHDDGAITARPGRGGRLSPAAEFRDRSRRTAFGARCGCGISRSGRISCLRLRRRARCAQPDRHGVGRARPALDRRELHLCRASPAIRSETARPRSDLRGPGRQRDSSTGARFSPTKSRCLPASSLALEAHGCCVRPACYFCPTVMGTIVLTDPLKLCSMASLFPPRTITRLPTD